MLASLNIGPCLLHNCLRSTSHQCISGLFSLRHSIYIKRWTFFEGWGHIYLNWTLGFINEEASLEQMVAEWCLCTERATYSKWKRMRNTTDPLNVKDICLEFLKCPVNIVLIEWWHIREWWCVFLICIIASRVKLCLQAEGLLVQAILCRKHLHLRVKH